MPGRLHVKFKPSTRRGRARSAMPSRKRATTARRRVAKTFAKFKKRPTNARKRAANVDGVTRPIAFTHGRTKPLSQLFERKVREAISNTNTQIIQGGFALTSTQGTCSYGMSAQLFDPYDLNTINSHMASGGPSQKYVVNSATLDIQISNCQNDPSYMRVYECVAREDIPWTVATGTSGYEMNTPLNYLYQGFADASLGSFATNYSSTVFQSPAFTCRYKVENVKTLQFAPGEIKRLHVADQKASLINMDRIYVGGPSNVNVQILQAMRQKTRVLIFQIWGSVMNDSGTKTLVSIDASKFDFVQTLRYDYKWNTDNTNTIYSSSTLGTGYSPEFINPLAAVIATPVQA